MLVGRSWRTPSRGLSIIELMVVITLVGILLALGIPGFGAWIGNSRVRSVAEELQNALREAHGEAVSRNRMVALVRTAATPALNAAAAASGGNWYLQVEPLAGESSLFVKGGAFSNQSNATVGGPDIVCFNSAGRLMSGTLTGVGACDTPSGADTRLNIDVTGTGGRRLRLEVFFGGRVRMCDRDAASGQPNACTS